MAEPDRNNPRPFRWTRHFLRLLVDERYIEELEGDLDEEFLDRSRRMPSWLARLRDAVDAISMLRPYSLRRRLPFNLTSSVSMLRHYLKSGLRASKRSAGYSALNILGLATGMACFLLVGLFVHHHLTFDGFHDEADRLYRLLSVHDGGKRAAVPAGIAPILGENLPEIRSTVRISGSGEQIIGRTDDNGTIHRRLEADVLYVDPAFLEAFSFQIVSGDAASALQDPGSIVLTRSTASRYFPNEDPVGKPLLLKNETELTVSAVVEDPPANSSIQFDFLLPLRILGDSMGSMFEWQTLLTSYVQLESAADPVDLATSIPNVLSGHTDRQSVLNAGYELQPIEAIHLYPINGRASGSDGVSPALLRLFGIIGLFILIIACINYVNLATARAAGRAPEIGMRKATGARRTQIVAQMLTESVLMSLVSTALAFVLARATLPILSGRLGIELEASLLSDVSVVSAIVGFGILVGLVAGAYPAVQLSAFSPIRALRGGGARTTRGSGNLVRRSLVVFQFATSVGLVVGLFVIRDQMTFIQQKDLGFTADRIVALPLNRPGVRDLAGPLTERLGSISAVENVSLTSAMPGRSSVTLRLDQDARMAAGEPELPVDVFFAESSLLEALGVEIVEGRGLLDGSGDAGHSALVNRATVRALGWTEPIGETLPMGWGEHTYTVVGVVEDFHMTSLRSEVGPAAILPVEDFIHNYAAIRLASADESDALAAIEATWNDVIPDVPFDYYFLDDYFAGLYDAERRQGNLMAGFSALALVIACLGLIGLAAYSTEQRRKEIGIRKVLGASIGNLLGLINREYMALILIGFILGAPVAYVMSERWLSTFAYHVDLDWKIFALAGVLVTALAAIAVAYQSLRAALANPADTLRT